jgi:hypothetical protein
MGLRLDYRAGAVLCALALLNATVISLVKPGVGGCVAAAVVWAVCMLLLATEHPRGLLSLECLYLLLLGLFHLGTVVPATLGADVGERPEWLDSRHLQPALGLFSAATCAFTLGARLHGRSADDGQRTVGTEMSLLVVGLGVALVGAVLLVIGAQQLRIFSGAYDQYYEVALTADVRFFGFGVMLFPMGVLIAAVGASPRQMYLLAALLGAVLGPFFLTGFRGHAIVHGAALIAIWARKDLRVARRLAAAGVLGLFVLAPAIRVARSQEQTLAQSLAKVRPLEFLTEAGGSMYPLVATHELLNTAGEPLWMGHSYAVAVERILPNVSLSFRPALSRGIEDDAPALWLVDRIDPWLAERGGSYGFSAVAEPYLNFGWLGVLAFFVGLGYLMRSADTWFARDPIRAAPVAASFGFLLWTVRNDATGLLRAVAMSVVIVCVAWIARTYSSAERQAVSSRSV